METGSSVSWRLLGASVAGTRHQTLGRVCEDAHGYRLLADGGVALSVADGAGSAARAAEASAGAVQAALDTVEARFSDGDGLADPTWQETLLRDAIQAARSALIQRARLSPDVEVEREDDPGDSVALDARLRELATTFLLAVASRHGIAVVQIGDGAIIVSDRAGAVRVVTSPAHGEYLNETTFLTADDFLDRAQFFVSTEEDVRAVAILTDGLELVALNRATGEPHPPFFRPLWEFASQPNASEDELVRFLSSDRLKSYTDDDKTLVLAVRCITEQTGT